MIKKKKAIAKKTKVVTKKAVSKRKLVEKPFNEGTMSNAAFFGMIRSSLRNRSRFWKPIQAVKNRGKIPYVGPNKRRKFSYICERCKKEYDAKQVAVHHKIECGSLNCFADLPGFVERLFCKKEDLILLCKTCHDKEHLKVK